MTNNRSKILDALFFKGRMHRLNAREMFLANMFGTGGGSGGQLCTVSGTDSIVLPKAAKNGVMHLTQYGVVEQNGTPTPNAPVDLVCNNGVISARHQSGLPLGYKLIEYVEADGAPYALTDYLITSDDVIEAEYCNLSESGYGSLYGVYKTGESSAFYANNTYYGYNVTNAKVDTGVSVDTEWHTLVHDFAQGKLTLDGVDTLFEPFVFTNTAQNAVFARLYNNAYGYFWKGRCRGWQARKSGALTCKLIPCVRESDSEIGFYDVVSGTFYSNVGSGAFAAGSDVTDPVEIYIDGTPETVTVTGKNLYNAASKVDNTRLGDDGRRTNSTGYFTSTFIPVKPNTTYTFSYTSGTRDNARRVCGYSSASSTNFTELLVKLNTVDGGNAGTNVAVQFTTGATTTWLRLSAFMVDTNVQVELGSTATAYQRYHAPQTASVSDLLQVGDYADTQDFISGIVTRNVGIKLLDGTEHWAYTSGEAYTTQPIFGDDKPSVAICTHFQFNSSAQIGGLSNGQFALLKLSPTELTGCISVKYDGVITSAATAASFFASNHVILLYQLDEPTTESVPAQHITNGKGDNLTVTATANVDDIPLVGQYKCIGCNITATVTNGTASGATKMYPGETATVTLTPNAGYSYFPSISVTGATYSYNSSTQTITLTNPTGDITITATAELFEAPTISIEDGNMLMFTDNSDETATAYDIYVDGVYADNISAVDYVKSGDTLKLNAAPYTVIGDTLYIGG